LLGHLFSAERNDRLEQQQGLARQLSGELQQLPANPHLEAAEPGLARGRRLALSVERQHLEPLARPDAHRAKVSLIQGEHLGDAVPLGQDHD
jgi:hypothetical protein